MLDSIRRLLDFEAIVWSFLFYLRVSNLGKANVGVRQVLQLAEVYISEKNRLDFRRYPSTLEGHLYECSCSVHLNRHSSNCFLFWNSVRHFRPTPSFSKPWKIVFVMLMRDWHGWSLSFSITCHRSITSFNPGTFNRSISNFVLLFYKRVFHYYKKPHYWCWSYIVEWLTQKK